MFSFMSNQQSSSGKKKKDDNDDYKSFNSLENISTPNPNPNYLQSNGSPSSSFSFLQSNKQSGEDEIQKYLNGSPNSSSNLHSNSSESSPQVLLLGPEVAVSDESFKLSKTSSTKNVKYF